MRLKACLHKRAHLQSKPDIGLDSRGDNVWIVRPGNPDKRGQVHYGDLVVFESARYPGYYIRFVLCCAVHALDLHGQL
jgi:hypothetical protein